MLLCRRPRIFDIDAIALAVVILLAALTWIGAIRPLHARRLAAAAEQQEHCNQLEQAKQQLARLEDAVAQRQSLAASLRESRDLLAESNGLPGVVTALERLCLETNLLLEEFVPGPLTLEPHYAQRQAIVQLNGRFHHFHLFLSRLQSDLPYLWPRSMSIAARPDDETAMCHITLELDIFTPPDNLVP